jgi:hypothetical protein
MKKAFFGEFFWSRAMHLDASLTDIQWGEQGGSHSVQLLHRRRC